MNKLVAIAAAAASALVLAAPSAAKEMRLLQVCGASGCNTIKSAGSLGHHGGFQPTTRPSLQSYYVVRVGLGDGKRIFGREDMYFVPGPGAVTWRTDDPNQTWMAFPARPARSIRAAAKGLEPFGAPHLASAYIGERRSVDPAPYMALLGPLDKAYVPSALESPISVSLNWQRPNPWSNDGALLNYLAKAKVLLRSDGYFHVPDALADRLDREHRGLAPVVPGDGFPWGLLVGGLGGALVIAGALVAFARRRPRPAEHRVPA